MSTPLVQGASSAMAEHLREIGLPLGARLKLLRAVAIWTGALMRAPAALGAGEQTPASPKITPLPARTDAGPRYVKIILAPRVEHALPPL
jgi:hypothetical protein